MMFSSPNGRRMMRRLWRDYSLSITLGSLWLTLWAGQWLVEAPLAANDPTAPAWLQWTAHTLENNQSEAFQLTLFVVLTSFLIHRGSHESKDSADDETHARLIRIEAKLEEFGERRP
jgi:hypothetical protein